MSDERKTKTQLIGELAQLRQRIAELKTSEAARKRAEAHIMHLNEVLRAVRNVNQLITRERDPQRLLSDACAILVRTRGYRMAWIGLIEEGHQRVLPAARAGQGTDYLDQVTITWDESETGQGPTGTAIRTRRPAACRDIAIDPRYAIWREAALAHGLGSSAVAPMVYGERLFGIVTIYADKPETFDEEEINLLSELAGDLAFALQSIEDEAERKRAEGALRRSQADLTHAQALVHIGSWRVVFGEGEVWSGSDELYRIYGYPLDMQMTTQSIFDRMHPDDRDRVWENWSAFLRGEAPDEWEHRIVVDGQVKWIHVHAQARFDATGRLIEVTGTNQDITERKQVEEALRVSEERFALAMRGSNDGLWDWDIRGNTLYWSPRLKELLGYADDELEIDFDTFDSLLHPDDRERVAAAIEAHLKDRKLYDVEERQRTKSGEYRWYRARGQALWDEAGNPIRMVGFTSDITERKRAEEALSRAEQRYRQLFEEAPVMYVITRNQEGVPIVVDCNQLFLSALGYAHAEVVEQPLTNFYTPQSRAKLVEGGYQQALQGSFVPEERGLVTRDGRVIKTLLHTVPEVDAEGRVIGTRAMYVDITERKRMEAALLDKVAALQTLNEIDREIMAATGRQGILDLVCRRAAELMHAPKSAIAIKTASGEFEMTASFGLRDPGRARLEFTYQWQAGLMHPAGVRAYGAIALNDIPADNLHMSEFCTHEDVRAYALAQLVAGQELIGVLMMFDSAPREWSADALQLLDLLAGQAAIAFEKTRLYEMARSRAMHLETLNTIGQAITSTLDLDRVLATLLENVVKATDVEACSVALVEAGSGDLVFRQAAGQAGWVVVGMRVKPGQGVAGWVATHRQPAMILDVVSDPRFYEQIDGTTGFTTRSLVCVPMIAHDNVIGVIELINKRTGTFGKDDVQLLEAVVAQAAVAIENARLFETERSARQLLETLYGIGQAINASLDVEAILNHLTDEAMRATHATLGSAIVARLDLDRFDRRSLRGYTPEQAERARHLFLPLGQGLNGRAYRTRQTVYLPDVRTDPDYFALIPETRSELVIPILRSGQVLANLDLQSPKVDAFRDVDTGFLQALIDQVAIALENARLYEETRHRLDEMAIVSQVALIGAAGRPFDEAVSRAVEAMRRLWPDSNVGFLFVDEMGQALLPHAASQDVSPELVANSRTPLNQGITGWVARERQPVRVGDVTLDPRYVVGMPGVRSEMAAPLLVGERAIGVINVECPWPNAYSGDDLRVLMALAGQLATIFEKSRLDAELIQHAAMLEQRVEERTAELQAVNEQLRRANDQVRRALEKERELGELKSRFVSMASHEFRTPLTSILSSAEMLEYYSRKLTEEKKIEHLHRIQASVQNMIGLLEDVLIVGKAEAGKLEFTPAPMDLVEFCHDLVEELRLSIASKHTLCFGSQGQCGQALMDEGLVRQILLNLISNACKYSPPGSPVNFDLTCQADRAILMIQDYGIGIPPEDQAHLFETFHRARNVGKIPGTGLGMAIVKRAVDLQGGNIQIASQVGVGTTVTVTLPLEMVKPPSPAT